LTSLPTTPIARMAETTSRLIYTGVFAGLTGFALVSVLYLFPPPSLGSALLAGVGLVALLALAIVRYEAAVALGFVLLGVVSVEPAPSDIVFAIVIVVALVTGRFDLSRVPLLITGLLIAFLALNLISAMEAQDTARAALFLSITAYLAVFAMWLTGFVDGTGHARLVLLGYLTAAVASAALGSLALLVGFPGSENFLLGGCCRAQGLFQDPNVFGPFLVPAALLLLQETIEPRLIRLRTPFKVVLFGVLVVGVLLSFSRGAIINLGLGLLVLLMVMLLRRGGARRLPALLAVLGVAVIGAIGALSVGESAELLESRSTVQSYDSDRFNAQRTGIEIAFEHPAGVGPGQFEVISPLATHSTYVRVLAEQGTLGLFAFAVLMLATLLLAARNALGGYSAYGIGSAALLAAWCGILANSLVVDTLHWRHLWMIAALIWVASMRRGPPETR
jgi:hypothetical protein